MATALAQARSYVSELKSELGDDGRVLVMTSGGKDSAAAMALLREQLPSAQVAACFLYLVPGLICVEGAIEACCARLGITQLIKLPHPIATVAMQASLYRPQRGSVVGTYEFGDCERVGKTRTVSTWTANGMRCADSMERRAMIKSAGAVDRRNRRVYPIAFWKVREVSAYVQAKKLPIASAVGARRDGNGITFDDDVLSDIADRFPSDWRKFKEFYPHAEAAIIRRRERLRVEALEVAALEAGAGEAASDADDAEQVSDG